MALISKISEPSGPQHARPITVFCNIYRLWGRVLCAQVLQAWAGTLPPSVVGYVSGRSAVDLAYWCQSKAEEALSSSGALSGMAVDLMPRPPIRQLLIHLGLPDKTVAFWTSSLQHVTRLFSVNQSLSGPQPCTTGAPEGDPVSVLAMVGLCWMFTERLRSCVEPAAFADNWTWLTSDKFQHQEAVHRLLELTSSVRMVVDWSKAYFWAVDAPTRRWWKTAACHVLPRNIAVSALPCVKELGSHLQFEKRRHLGHLAERMQESTLRLRRLFHLPVSLRSKAHVVQAGVYPYLWHGAFGVGPGRQKLGLLRGHVARAVVGRHHTMSSAAAVTLVPGLEDPELYLLRYQLAQLRRAFRVAPGVAEVVLRIASSPKQPLTPFGPGSALRTMLARFDWEIDCHGTCKGPARR